MRKSLRGNDLVVWKEWVPAGLEVPLGASSLGREGSQSGGGPPGKGRTFFLVPRQSKLILHSGFPHHTYFPGTGVGKGILREGQLFHLLQD